MPPGQKVHLEEVIQALKELGGEANWSDILNLIKKEHGDSCEPYSYQKSFDETTFQHIQEHCEGYAKFKKGPILFKQVRKGRFSLVSILPVSLTPIAADIADSPNRVLTETYRILRDTKLAREVKESHEFKCQVCSNSPLKLSDVKLYAEAHHIKPLGSPHDGPDVRENILCACPNCHVLLDYGAIELHLDRLIPSANHTIGGEYVDYHNSQIFQKVNWA